MDTKHDTTKHRTITDNYKVGDTKVFDTELTFSRVIGLQASSCDVDMKPLLSCGLLPVPPFVYRNWKISVLKE